MIVVEQPGCELLLSPFIKSRYWLQRHLLALIYTVNFCEGTLVWTKWQWLQLRADFTTHMSLMQETKTNAPQDVLLFIFSINNDSSSQHFNHLIAILALSSKLDHLYLQSEILELLQKLKASDYRFENETSIMVTIVN